MPDRHTAIADIPQYGIRISPNNKKKKTVSHIKQPNVRVHSKNNKPPTWTRQNVTKKKKQKLAAYNAQK